MNVAPNNRILLCGCVKSAPVFSHEIFDEKFYQFELEIKRLSGQSDVLPVVFSQRLTDPERIGCGERFSVEGQLRSYNIFQENHSRLQLQTFAREILRADEEEDMNRITLTGYICKAPIYRVTPFSREIADLLLAVNRAYGKSDYIPTICWGRNARYCQTLKVGQPVTVEGRLQSRNYQKVVDENTVVQKVAFEVSVAKLTVEKDENEPGNNVPDPQEAPAEVPTEDRSDKA